MALIFKPNDWGRKSFLLLVITTEILLIFILSLDSKGIDLPAIRQLIGFFFLTFIPGVTLLRTFRIHNLNLAKTILYSVGLSIAFVMFDGFIINTILFHTGITKPITLTNLTTSLILFTSILAIITYILDKDYTAPSGQDTLPNDMPRPGRNFMIEMKYKF